MGTRDIYIDKEIKARHRKKHSIMGSFLTTRTDNIFSITLKEHLKRANEYKRIAGYFRLSIFEIINIKDINNELEMKILCNPELSDNEIDFINSSESKLKLDWLNNRKYLTDELKDAMPKLIKYMDNAKYNEKQRTNIRRGRGKKRTPSLEIRVVPNNTAGFLHGKFGLIKGPNNNNNYFIGSVNETLNGWNKNYETVYFEDNPDHINFNKMEDEFNYFWDHKDTLKGDLLYNEIIRPLLTSLTQEEIPIKKWRDDKKPQITTILNNIPFFKQGKEFWPHQKKFITDAWEDYIKRGSCKFLLADDVGLGKTLQLGFLGQLISLKEDKDMIIFTPKSIQLQWQESLLNDLGINASRWSDNEWTDSRGNKSKLFDKPLSRVQLISLGTIINTHENSIKVKNKIYSKKYGAIIIDEAHVIRCEQTPEIMSFDQIKDKSKDTERNIIEFGLKIADCSNTILLGTATPIQLNYNEALILLYILSNSLKDTYVLGNEKSYWVNEQWIDKIHKNGSFDNSYDKNYLIINPMKTNNIFHGKDINSIKKIEDAKKRLNHRETIENNEYEKGYFINSNPLIFHVYRRTREFLEEEINKKTGKTFLKKIVVNTTNEIIELTESMDNALNLTKALLKSTKGNDKKIHVFLTKIIEKRINSSVESGIVTCNNIINNDENALFKYEDINEEEYIPFSFDQIQIIEDIKNNLNQSFNYEPKYSKIKELITQYKDNGLILFSQFFTTSDYFSKKISTSVFPNEIIGLYSGEENSGYYENGVFFKDSRSNLKKLIYKGRIKILFATDAASEGLNLQVLSSLVNIDLPWNPRVLEQRVGRIKRPGQLSDFINVHNIIYSGSIECRVMELLFERSNISFELFGHITKNLDIENIDEILDTDKHKLKINELKIAMTDKSLSDPFSKKYSNADLLNKFDKDIDWNVYSSVVSSSDFDSFFC
jgi:superfamily II DNA or RNA helicase